MGFIEQFFKNKKEIKPEDIESFIAQNIEENQNLDYKRIQAYHNVDKLSDHVASFANSTGGLIILGVSQDEIKDEKGRIIKIYPKKSTWGEVSLDKETLENRLLSKIQPAIPKLVIKPVRNEKHEVIFLIDIPKSDCGPHMSSDHRYNSRTNFRKRAMEHYEVANVFKTNWTLKEKLIEKIYEPLSEILEKQIKQLAEFRCPFSHDFEEVLSKTYYKTQMPFELFETIDIYIERVEDLNKKEHYARIAKNKIVNVNVLEYLKKEDTPSNNEFKLNFKVVSSMKSHIDLHPQTIFQLLLSNQEIRTYLNKVHWRDTFEKISIIYSNETYDINLDEFDELVWKKCLKEASNNTAIQNMKESVEALISEAWYLLEKITQ